MPITLITLSIFPLLAVGAWILDIRFGQCSHCKALAIKHRYTTENTQGRGGVLIVETERCLVPFRHQKVPDHTVE
ncbi:MAG: hypothetical protein A3C06_00635 [Candidatus Taylorbacteria bacterium RIFCSPHIGHO2_02_FULL_46_13]|uniref:Uncharacterized protein n=1 Tax=Candidatus Taylorbacteria bacterium RIFCSPHIGHO2_02_FULL_46_13 TaxID=1802312 RepID=A0A1G2MW93_9BACT|nr:MAG: hypothetical protein A3C06_00635 [Candidatus Taylorbacteria bacterium RIFCSPHIGHO2_02_FULL_46_13]